MKLRNLLMATVAAVALGAVPVGALAQETPQAGGSESGFWAGLPIGSNVMIGGLIFVVTATGLVLLDDDDDPVPPAPTPTPPPATPTSTTTT